MPVPSWFTILEMGILRNFLNKLNKINYVLLFYLYINNDCEFNDKVEMVANDTYTGLW